MQDVWGQFSKVKKFFVTMNSARANNKKSSCNAMMQEVLQNENKPTYHIVSASGNRVEIILFVITVP